MEAGEHVPHLLPPLPLSPYVYLMLRLSAAALPLLAVLGGGGAGAEPFLPAGGGRSKAVVVPVPLLGGAPDDVLPAGVVAHCMGGGLRHGKGRAEERGGGEMNWKFAVGGAKKVV